MKIARPEAERFWEKVNKNGPIPDYAPELGPCWIYTRAKSDTGYGVFRATDGRLELAHHTAIRLSGGTLPTKGFDTDHLCRVKACVRFDTHLETVTHQVNNKRGISRGTKATHCPHGHPYDEANTCVSGGKRFCLTCARLRNRESRERKRLAHAAMALQAAHKGNTARKVI